MEDQQSAGEYHKNKQSVHVFKKIELHTQLKTLHGYSLHTQCETLFTHLIHLIYLFSINITLYTPSIPEFNGVYNFHNYCLYKYLMKSFEPHIIPEFIRM